jgi:hypothetical protein
MNNDGFLDIVHLGTEGLVWAYNRNGTVLAPWNGVRYTTLTSGASESSPVVADINGDGFNDIVCGGEDSQLTALSGADGSVLPGFPIQLGGEVRGTPALADIDKDGKTEIVLAGWDKNIYVWDYDFPFSPGKTPPWPQFHHDARRTGLASNAAFLSVELEAAAPTGSSIELSAPQPNPSFARAQMWYSIPSAKAGDQVELAVYDLAGRRVAMLQRGDAHAGRYKVTWDLSDDRGNHVEPGLYFARLTTGAEVHSQKLIVIH